MKIGIVTIYDGNNMGSFLQAVAFRYALEDMGHSVYFVQRMSEEDNLNLFLNRPFSKTRPFPFNYMAKIKRMIFNRTDDNKRREEIKKIYEVLSVERKSLPVIEPDNLDQLDLLICGSDEIWNFRNTSISVPFYSCLEYGENIKKLAFAVSIGISTIEDFNCHPEIISAISRFDNVFPRDQHSKKVLEKALDKSLEIVCDPTLLVDREKLCKHHNRLVEKPYIMVYAYDLSNEEQELLGAFSKETGLPIISVLHYLKIADEIITESPYLFANLISNAEYCYTSTFHGTIFCTLFAKRFLYHARRPKVKEVAEYIGIEERVWDTGDFTDFKSKMMEDINRAGIDKKLESIRTKNLQILNRVVN